MAIEQIERLPDVSFIDDDINLDGIQKQMLQDYQDKYMEETGEETVLDRGEPIALSYTPAACRSTRCTCTSIEPESRPSEVRIRSLPGQPGSAQGHRENCAKQRP